MVTDEEYQLELEIGTLFQWTTGRPAITVKKGSAIPTLISGGHLVAGKRPGHWWYLVSWFRVCRALWRMPHENLPNTSAVYFAHAEVLAIPDSTGAL
jgi:hypothetical protein